MKQEDVYDKASKELGMPRDFIEKVYKAYWKSIKDMLEALPLKRGISEEVFNNTKTSFNIPSLGKLYTTYSKIKKIRDKNEHKEGNAPV